MIQQRPAQPKRAKHGWFDRVFASRISFSGHYVQLYFAPTLGLGGKFGVSVAKRTCPKSVDRNYAKRVLRAWYGQWISELANVDLVVRVKRRYDGRQFAALSHELGGLLNKAERWRASLS